MPNAIDQAAATELQLTIENESSLYPKRKAIEVILARKVNRGVYDASKAPKAWMHFVDLGAEWYSKQFPGVRFDRQTRLAVATAMAREYEAEIAIELQTAKLEAMAAQKAAKLALQAADVAAVKAINVQVAFNLAIKG